MITLGFGYSLLNDDNETFERKFFAFTVPDMSMEEFDELDQGSSHPDREEFAQVFDEAGVTATRDCCDLFSTETTPPNTILWADYNMEIPERFIVRGCEILREFFIRKGMATSAITEFTQY